MTSAPDPHWAALRAQPTDVALWQALLTRYLAAGLDWQAVYVARQMHRINPQLGELLDVQLAALPWRGQADGDAALGRATLADAPKRMQRLAQCLAEHPQDWLSWLYLCRLHDLANDPEAPQQAALPLAFGPDRALVQAQACELLPGESAHWLGVWRLKAGDAAGALQALRPLVDVRPLRHGSMMYLGEALLRLGQVQAAQKAFTRASLSERPVFLGELAARVYQHNYWQEAIGILQKAVQLAPEQAALWLQLARIQLQVYELDDCRQSLAQLQRLGHSDEAQALAVSLEGQYGDAKASLQQLQAAYERQQAAGEHNSRMVSSVLMTALYQDDWTPTQMAQLHQRYGWDLAGAALHTQAAIGAPAAPRARPTSLRVGYVTGDLHRQHPVNIFMLPLLQAQQHSSLQVHVYHTGTMFDSYTERARACAKHWVEAAHWDDATLQQAIAQDGIDVLIDLAGHTASHRLGVFMARPAPVQVTFLGYPHSTGLPCMDYLIGDAVVSPPEHAHLFSESVARLDYPVFCWAPVDAYALPPARAADAPVVFGSFNNALKLSERTLALWAQVLHAVPGSRLLLKAPSLRNAAVQARYLAQLQALGIEAWRVEFRGPSELADMMQQYGDIDIALDPLAYNGGTTSLQALWMGVPLVTLTGGNFASRMGTSFLTALDRAEWIAQDEASYVAIAQDLASQVQTLRPQRPQLRQHMEASALCDITGYARSFERLLWQMSDATRTADGAGMT